MAEELRLEERLGDRAAVHRHEGAPGPRRAAVDQRGDALLAGAALPGDQHRRVDPRHPPRQVEGPAHGLAAGQLAVLVAGRLGRHDEAARCQPALVGQQRGGQPLQRRVQGGPVVGHRAALPVLLEAALHPAVWVAPPGAGGLPDHHLAAVGARHVAGREGGEGPADRLGGGAEVEPVLLGLVGVVPEGLGERMGRGVVGHRLHPHQPLQRVEPPAGAAPVALLLPGEGRPHGLGRAPPVGVAEAGEQGLGAGQAVAGDELGAQQA